MKNLIKYFLLLTAVVSLQSCSSDEETVLKADFEFEEIDGNQVRFINTSTGDDSNKWEIEGTVYTNKEIVTKYFPKKGPHVAKLTVYQKAEQKSVSKTFSLAQDDVVASFELVETEKVNTWLIQNNTSGSYDSIEWDFGNGQTSTEVNPGEVYYPYKGKYTIYLTLVKNGVEFGAEKTLNVLSDDESNPDELVWSDEFNGSTLNTSNWTYETGSGGWGNQELQNYTNGGNATIKNGKLVITARKINDLKQAGSYTSTRIKTQGKQSFLYGRIEARIKLPSGSGTWPAFWMLGENISSGEKPVGWPKCGEIDIMEHVGYKPNNHLMTIHNEDSYGDTKNKAEITYNGIENDFRVFGITWTPKEIRFYVDEPSNVKYIYKPSVYNDKTWPFNKEQFILLNFAIGGTLGAPDGKGGVDVSLIDNSIFPQEYIIDYVRVYK